MSKVHGQGNTEDLEDLEVDELDQLNQTGEDIYDGLIVANGLYIGWGTLIVLLSSVVGVLFCLMRNCSRFPNFCTCLGFLIPVGVYGALRQLEFESLESDEKQTDLQP